MHANLKDSAVDDFIDTLHTEEKRIGRECTRAEICELYIERDKCLRDKLAAKDVYSGHLMPDTRSAITDETQGKARATRKVAHVGDGPLHTLSGAA